MQHTALAMTSPTERTAPTRERSSERCARYHASAEPHHADITGQTYLVAALGIGLALHLLLTPAHRLHRPGEAPRIPPQIGKERRGCTIGGGGGDTSDQTSGATDELLRDLGNVSKHDRL